MDRADLGQVIDQVARRASPPAGRRPAPARAAARRSGGTARAGAARPSSSSGSAAPDSRTRSTSSRTWPLALSGSPAAGAGSGSRASTRLTVDRQRVPAGRDDVSIGRPAEQGRRQRGDAVDDGLAAVEDQQHPAERGQVVGDGAGRRRRRRARRRGRGRRWRRPPRRRRPGRAAPTGARRSNAPCPAATWDASRDLPTPPWPVTVTRPGRASAAASAAASRSRPMNEVVSAPGPARWPRRPGPAAPPGRPRRSPRSGRRPSWSPSTARHCS